MVHGKKIMLSPLDWGLGHATRCIPIIRELLQNNCTVIVAGTPKTNALIREVFPDLPYEILKGYEIRYSPNRYLMPLWMLAQGPKLFRAIRYEHQWLKEKCIEWKPDMILSDNRYGFYHRDIPSVIITHQIHIQVPQSAWIQKLVNQRNHQFIKKFHQCWIPDQEGHHLAGDLSLPAPDLNIRYIGWLSRFIKPSTEPAQDIDYLFLLSGPEPQRSKLEQKILAETKDLPGRKVLVRGVPDSKEEWKMEGFQIHPHLPTDLLQSLILRSRYILCRPGYTTLMDLIRLGKSALLIPTPGQTEQEYLARYVTSKKWFMSMNQGQSLVQGINQFLSFQAEKFPEEVKGKE